MNEKQKRETVKRAPRGKRGQYKKFRLNVFQAANLVQLWHDFPGEFDEFVEKVARCESSDPRTITPATLLSTKLQLERIEAGDRQVSHEKFRFYAQALGTSEEELLVRLSAMKYSSADVPWKTDEKVIAGHRELLHHYHQTIFEGKTIWIYTLIDFTKPFRGYLYSPIRIGLKADRNYKAYGYLLRQSLLLVLKSNQEGDYRWSFHLYHDYRKKTRDNIGQSGVIYSEDWDNQLGIGGTLIFKKPFPNSGEPGEQNPKLCKELAEHWKILEGQSCNRVFRIFGQKEYDRPQNARNKLFESLNPSTRRAPKAASE